ncbi:MAG: hypothetical protein A2070_11625 [Bdellovibrionales bacterium GWC1_52_8]|nr:MAG: hypothetical protein A2X97_07590 [Bdellovibrionales bacterium GWA1_52_35]OFZ40324.1 MAG: hypothetical protein A2070_11625 [Bdellovibrionales bacterium GWC1_52_8]
MKLFVLFAFLLAFTGCRREIEGLGAKVTLDQRKLSNDLVVIMVEDHTVPIISYQTWFRVGSVDEHGGSTGMAHLFEHLMFKGTPKFGPRRFFRELEAKGAEVNAFTTRDYTVYFENFVPNLLEKVVDMESDRMANLTLTEETLNTEKLVVLEERRLRAENTPEGKMQEALWALAYRYHPYQFPVIGYAPDLLNLNVEQMTAFYRSHYQPANAALVIVGDFKTDHLWSLIQKYYGPLKNAPRPLRKFAAEPQQEEERQLILRDQVASERFSSAYHVTSAEKDDSFALDVLANILFEGTHSRAYRSIVEEQNLAITISGSAYTPTYPGLFMINAVMKGGVPATRVQTALNELIGEVQENSVTAEEIQRAVRQLTVQMLDSIRTPQGLGQLIGTVHTILGDSRDFSSDLQKYLNVTREDVKRVAQKYLIPNNRSIVTLVPKAGKK